MTHEVTGFHLVVLCHRFRRRARVFLDSLLRQSGNPYKLHLTIFYSEEEDGKLLHEMLPPDGLLTRDLFEIPEHRIMERSVLFSSITPHHDCSHVVYTDCDLWFPDTFWYWYGNALEEVAWGYWSAYVREIQYVAAEEILNKRRLYYDDLSYIADEGFKYDDIHGMVGHFQCVPKGLAKYPAHRLASVCSVDYHFAKQAVAQSQDFSEERRLPHVPYIFHFGHPYSWEGTEVIL